MQGSLGSCDVVHVILHEHKGFTNASVSIEYDLVMRLPVMHIPTQTVV